MLCEAVAAAAADPEAVAADPEVAVAQEVVVARGQAVFAPVSVEPRMVFDTTALVAPGGG